MGLKAQVRSPARRCCSALLQSKVVCDFDLERLLTAIRRGLLQYAIDGGPDITDAGSLEFFCALAQQCFINEYVFALGNTERPQVATISDRIVGALKDRGRYPQHSI